MKSVGVAILTFNSYKHLKPCLSPLLASPIKPKILVVDSSSKDGTAEEAKNLGVEVIQIDQKQFNHGKTREYARKRLNTDIVVMMTPDAYAVNEHMLEHLIRPLIQESAVISYARQIPKDGAGFFEAFPRHFNYPTKSQLRGIEDVEKYGSYTFFCSDSCCAYLNRALDEIGGFREVVFGEDTLAAADLLRKGYRISYTAEAVVQHSHDYTLIEEFKRHFDTGLVRKIYAGLLLSTTGDQSRGKDYVKAMFQCLLKQKPTLIPYGFLHTAAKFLGYKIGSLSVTAPKWLKVRCSSQSYYWQNKI